MPTIEEIPDEDAAAGGVVNKEPDNISTTSEKTTVGGDKQTQHDRVGGTSQARVPVAMNYQVRFYPIACPCLSDTDLNLLGNSFSTATIRVPRSVSSCLARIRRGLDGICRE